MAEFLSIYYHTITSSISAIETSSLIDTLPFNPFKLAGLIAWIYFCMYLVQHVQFGTLVPTKYKPYASLITLLTGPILLSVFFCVHIIKERTRTGEHLTDIIKKQLANYFGRVNLLKRVSGKDSVKLTLLDSSGRTFDEIYGHSTGDTRDSHILQTTEYIVANALVQRASDILIDPKDESTYTVRLRVDGVLQTVRQFKKETARAIINSIKAISGMDIAERRRPQDGAFLAKNRYETSTFRVASAGALNGEKVSIRVLNKDAGKFTLSDVGFTRKQRYIIEEIIKKPSGMILICGPTGSGKTTTMYALLNQIDRYTRNVVTAEDPIEAVLPESSQIEINPKADITFAKTLRSILRQDPDVICVGEIRDEESAEIALRAAQTGHLVLATIHCDSNASALVRLLDLDISPLLMTTGLSLLISQRLIRKLCEQCKKPAHFNAQKKARFERKSIDYSNIYTPTGCKKCNNTGYYDRIAICDLLVMTDEFRDGITKSNTFISKLKTEGNKKGKSNLKKQALRKVVEGITSLEELDRIIG